MKSNLKEIFERILPELQASKDIGIEEILNEIMPEIRFEDRPSKMDMAREIIRGRLTTALNSNGIYSFQKGHFVSIENADEEQLKFFMDKAKRDMKAAERRKQKAEERFAQISMAWDENGQFIGFHIPPAMNL